MAQQIKNTAFMPKAKYDSFRKEVEDMTPKAKALLIVTACKRLCEFIGLNFLGDMTVYWLSYMAGLMVVIYLFLATYTLIYYTYHNEFSTGIKGTCVVGIAVPVCLFESHKKLFFAFNVFNFCRAFYST